MPTLPALPLSVRVINSLGRALAMGGIRPLRFEPKALRERAVRQSGLDDFDEDPLFCEALEELCRSIENDASLTLAGRVGIRDYVVHALVNRLRYVRARAAEPEVADIELEPPIIVVGLPRSGTTLLHHLLSLDPVARPLRFWEVMEPIPGLGPDRRREDMARTVAKIKHMDGAIDGKHHFDADNPEECMLLLDATLCSAAFWVFAPVHGYLEWLRHQDLRAPYAVYRWYLQRFQRDNPGRRLVLKAPAHTTAIEALLGEIPSARLVQTHRVPTEVAPSLDSLIVSLHAMVADPVDIARMSQNNLAQLQHMLATASKARAAGHRWIDVGYEALVRDPVASVRNIHERLELPFSEASADRIREHMAQRPKGKFGEHRYRAEDFGTTESDLSDRFADYHQFVLTLSH